MQKLLIHLQSQRLHRRYVFDLVTFLIKIGSVLQQQLGDILLTGLDVVHNAAVVVEDRLWV